MKLTARSLRWTVGLCGGWAALIVGACNSSTAPVTGPDVPFDPNSGQGTPDVIVTGGNIDLGLTCLGFPSNAILADTPQTQTEQVVPVAAVAPDFEFSVVEENISGTPGEITSFSILVQDNQGSGVAILEFDLGTNSNIALTFGPYLLTSPSDATGPSITLTSIGAGGVCRSVIGDRAFIEDLDIDRNAGPVGQIQRLRLSFLLGCGQGCITFIDLDNIGT